MGGNCREQIQVSLAIQERNGALVEVGRIEEMTCNDEVSWGEMPYP